MDRYYILDGRKPVRCYDLIDWSGWFDRADRAVAKTVVGGTMVSTVFLGIDHNFFGHGCPVLFETMVFCDEETCNDGFGQWRYCTWEEAEAGHRDVVAKLERIAAMAIFPQ